MHKGDVFGRYRLDRLLGSDYLGEVWAAFDTARRREVELRILPSEAAEDAEYLDRFWREAGITAQLQHPHIAPVHDYGMVDDRIFLATQSIAGRPLREFLENHGAMDALRASRIVEQLASALDAARAAGLHGRAVDPATVLIAEHGGAFLTGVGLAVGPAGRTDAQALTRILVACLTGEPAADDTTSIQALPPAMRSVVDRGHSGDPQRGYRSAGALAAGMRAALGQRSSGPSGTPRTILVDRPTPAPPPADRPGPFAAVHTELITTGPVAEPVASGSVDTEPDAADSATSAAAAAGPGADVAEPVAAEPVHVEPAAAAPVVADGAMTRTSRVTRMLRAARSASAARSAVGGRTDQHRGLVAALILAVVVWVGAIVGVVIGNGPSFRTAHPESIAAVPVNSQSPAPGPDRLPTVAALPPGAQWSTAAAAPSPVEVIAPEPAESVDPVSVEVLPCYPGYTHIPEPAGPCLPLSPAAAAPGLAQVLPCYDGYVHTPPPDGPCLPVSPTVAMPAAPAAEPGPGVDPPPAQAGTAQQQAGAVQPEVLPCYPGYVHTPSPDGPCLPVIASVELTAQTAPTPVPPASVPPATVPDPVPTQVLPCYDGYVHTPPPDGPCLPVDAGAPVPASPSLLPPSVPVVPSSAVAPDAVVLPCFDGYTHTPPPDGPCLPVNPGAGTVVPSSAPVSALVTSSAVPLVPVSPSPVAPWTELSDTVPPATVISPTVAPSTVPSAAVPSGVVLPCYPGYTHTPPPDGPCWAP